MRKMNAMGEDWLDDHVLAKRKKGAAGYVVLTFLLLIIAYLFVI